MPIILIPETGTGTDETANTFLDLAAADTYHEAVVESEAWDDAAPDEKNRALVQAARILSTQFDWKGCQTYPATQPLAFPRTGLSSDLGLVPRAVKWAQAEIARELLIAGGFQTRPSGQGGADALKGIGLGRGALKIEFQTQDEDSTDDNSEKTVVKPYVVELLRGLGAFQQGGNRIVRVRRR